ncbi:MAG: hypothetical protein CMQ75_06100 [Gammaproteobacteria bacterium]|nr:hypothetical protein [Gammaproteobacteria bacterium]
MKSSKQMFYRLLLLFLSLNLCAQEYEINSDKVEINTELNTITYSNNVTFISNNISFEADTLNIDQTNEAFTALGDPIKIKFFDGIEFIEGEAKLIEIISDSLILKNEVSITRSGNKIKSDKIIIKLSSNDQD